MIINYLLLFEALKLRCKSTIDRIIIALIIWLLNIYISVLVFSSVKMINSYTVFGLYILENGALLLYVVCKGCLSGVGEQIKRCLLRVFIFNGKLDFLSCFVATWLFVLGIIAIFTVPYNYDCITYHAPRIHLWVQNGSVFYYATHMMRQLVSPVLESYVTLYFYLIYGQITGSMCLPQYWSYVLAIYFIITLCRRFDVSRRFVQGAVILWITMPIAFAEAITQQDDLFSTVIMLASIVYIYEIKDKDERQAIREVVVLALLIGLAFVAKPNVCLATFFFLILYLIRCIKNKVKISDIIARIIIALCLIAVVISPQFVQNLCMSGGLLDSSLIGQRQLVGTIRPNYVFINFLKNFLYNWAFEWGTIGNTGIIKGIIYGVSHVLRVNPNSELISEFGFEFYFPSFPNYTCDSALQNTLMLVLLISVVMLIKYWKRIDGETKIFYGLSLISFCSFCSILIWEASVTRYMLCYLALLIVGTVPIIDKVVCKIKNKMFGKSLIVWLIGIFVVVDVIMEMFFIVKLHPVFPVKSSLTLYNNHYESYLRIADYVNEEADEVGLIDGETSVEYPFWIMFNNGTIIRHVNIREGNPSVIYEDKNYVPDVILSDCTEANSVLCHGYEYEKVMKESWWTVYRLVDSGGKEYGI